MGRGAGSLPYLCMSRVYFWELLYVTRVFFSFLAHEFCVRWINNWCLLASSFLFRWLVGPTLGVTVSIWESLLSWFSISPSLSVVVSPTPPPWRRPPRSPPHSRTSRPAAPPHSPPPPPPSPSPSPPTPPFYGCFPLFPPVTLLCMVGNEGEPRRPLSLARAAG